MMAINQGPNKLPLSMSDKSLLSEIASNVMLSRGLRSEISPPADSEASRAEGQNAIPTDVMDLRHLLWCSIDNDDSRDLDQLTVAEELPDGRVKVLVAIADVDSIVTKDSALDEQASYNSTSVYTAGQVFPMLPEILSTNLTSLNPNEDRLAIVVEYTLNGEGILEDANVYRGCVRNKAKLAYNRVASWLEGQSTIPEAIAAVPGLEENLRLQDITAQKMKSVRETHGALGFTTIKGKPRFEGDTLVALDTQYANRATEIIQDFMIGANIVTAKFLEDHGFPAIRRVVHSPERWERIVALAKEYDYDLPEFPNAKALNGFLKKQKKLDPLRFPDLSLTVIKLMGQGEYVLEAPGETPIGHFGLAVKDYNHSTAPNRRYPDLITQRLVKAALTGHPCPYSADELTDIANHCTFQQDNAKKVERQVNKSAAALLLRNRIGETFEALVTGASPKGTFVRLLTMPVEGMLVRGRKGVDVGDKLQVRLESVDVERGFIDFVRC